MKKCKWVRKSLVAFLSGELNDEEQSFIEAHIQNCSDCDDELQKIKRIFHAADLKKQDFDEAMDSVDWDSLPQRIASRVFDLEDTTKKAARRGGFQPFFFKPGFRPVLAGLFVGILFGSFVTFIAFRGSRDISRQPVEFAFSQSAFDRVELEVARRDTIDYLDQSQLLLLDLVQSSSPAAALMWKKGESTQIARDLLSKKKYINPQLDRFRMAKAKSICDQIEILFYELALMNDRMTDEEFRQIRELIGEKQLLLKIKIVKKELEQSEV